MKTALILVAIVAIVSAEDFHSSAPVSVSPPVAMPPVVNPCSAGMIMSYADTINCRRFHLCYGETLYHMWCAPGRNFDVNENACLVGGQCFPNAFPIDLPVEEASIEAY